MEASGSERKRKRSRSHRRQPNSSGEVLAGESASGGEDGTGKASPAWPRPPLDEEVEEFFGILRRMHAAVNYFGKSGHDHGSGESKWTASETGLPLVNGGAEQARRGEQKGGDGVSFDLNVVPDEAAEFNGD